ncbi:MAG: hypothetical protein IIY44_02065 [Erysipelotrichales bacterium]|nr:hypothetical protein [Erysipelotrichales bacterium]
MNPNEQNTSEEMLKALSGPDTAESTAEDLSSPAKSEGVSFSDEIKNEEETATKVIGDTIPVTQMDSFKDKKRVSKSEEAEDVASRNERIKGRIRRLNASIIICLIICMIPVGVFGYIVYQAWKVNNTPITGNRFVGQHQPEITDANMESVKSALSRIQGVESVEAETRVSTTRILIDVRDDITEEEIRTLGDEIYAALNAVLPIGTYYTNTETMEMYDLDISVYNNLTYKAYPAEGEPKLVMLDIVKNGMMPEAEFQLVSSPKNEEAAKAARESVEERKKQEEAEKNGTTNETTEDPGEENTETGGEGTGA